jgi:Asp-tRNA(Asn)/Glu-tRNA(Gln) amidotransferase B subunit
MMGLVMKKYRGHIKGSDIETVVEKVLRRKG